jgi:hypothetical protein
MLSGSRYGSALTGLEARVQLVDDVYAALATNQTVFAVTGLQRLERIFDLHFSDPQFRRISLRRSLTIKSALADR